MKEKRFAILVVDNGSHTIKLMPTESPTIDFKRLSELVDGFIEIVSCKRSVIPISQRKHILMCVNDCGLMFSDYEVNYPASVLYGIAPIVGPCVVGWDGGDPSLEPDFYALPMELALTIAHELMDACEC